MKNPSMRANLLWLAGLYSISLVAAAGCPNSGGSTASRAGNSAKSKESAGSAQGSADSPPGERPARQDASDAAPPADGGAAKQPATSGSDKPKIDPVAINGRYFEGWPKPTLAIVFTGRQEGYLEPCGCAGLENQKGGISRRHTLIKQLAGRGWPVTAVDVGTLVRRFGKQAERQFAASAEALRVMGYQAVGFGPADLRLSSGEVVSAVSGDDPEKSMFISANVSVLGLTPRFRIFEVGGKKIGVTSILGDEFRKQLNNSDVEINAVDKSLKEVLPKLKGCDLKILLANATVEEAIELGKKFPEFDFVVPGSGADEPPADATPIEGSKAKLINIGHKAMYVVVLGFFDDPKQPVRYQRVALDSRFEGSPEMKAVMANYQSELQDMGWKELGLRPVAHPRASKANELSGQFAGAAACKDCHPTAYKIWHASKHAQATETLAKLDPPRQYDPECISCHSTGWSPQDFFPYKTGYDSLETTPHLAGNSCENCHGPGAAHIAAEKGKPSERDAQRELLKLTTGVAKNETCVRCHDGDNDPNFDFDRYWPKVKHEGKR